MFRSGPQVSRPARSLSPPSVIGTAVTWLVSNPEADGMRRTTVQVQELALEKGLHPDWRATTI